MRKTIFISLIIWLSFISTSFSQSRKNKGDLDNIDTVIIGKSKKESIIKSTKIDSSSAIKREFEHKAQKKLSEEPDIGISGQSLSWEMKGTEGQSTGIDSVSTHYRHFEKNLDTLTNRQSTAEKIIGRKDSVIRKAGSLREVEKKPFKDKINNLSASRGIPKADTLVHAMERAKSNFQPDPMGLDIDSIASRFDKTQFHNLPTLPGREVKTDYLPILDSLREQHLSDEKLKLVEKAADTLGNKEILLKEKSSLKQKLFFEGILGLNSNNLNMVSISPAVGVMLTKSISAGIGLNCGGDIRDIANNNVVGIRSFVKYELIEKKFYLQAEDNMSLTKISDIRWEEGYEGKAVDHAVLIGAGFLINYSSSNSINLVLLYQVNKDNISTDFASPFTLRLGLSMFSKK